MTLIIDCHGHYTTAPPQHDAWRDAQKAAFKDGGQPPPYPAISDDEIRETIDTNQLRLIKERGADHTIFSPRASAMAHHVGDQGVSEAWSIACNDLIYRVATMYPEWFTGVCMLPQSPKSDLAASVKELRRCVEQLGFVGCNLNPDPGGGHFNHPPLTDEYWFPVYEVMASLDASEKQAGWADKVAYNRERMETHGLRRAAEMEESAKTLQGLGVEPVMTRGTVELQRRTAKPKGTA